MANLHGCCEFDEHSLRILFCQAHTESNYENKIVSVANVNLRLVKKMTVNDILKKVNKLRWITYN